MGADAAGNMTYRETVAGGNRLTYKHDRWGRLTEVWFSNGAPSGTPNRAVYRYNGLSMRCLIERDSNAADSSNALNERRALYYGAGWQVLEERVDADKDADYDRLAQNVWGLRHIDDLVLRRANANWNAGADTDFSDAGDTDWEQFLNDHQFSVVAGVNRSGTLTFRLAYDAYGEARHSWAKDIDGDGDVDAADWTIAHDAQGKQIHQTGYVADADWNRDGTVTSTDVAAFGSAYYATALAGGLLASTSSDLNVGFCGYRFDAELGAYTVRFRHYDPTPGVARWLERDPAGYADGPSLYGYLGRSPIDSSDPLGLVGIQDGTDPAMDRQRPGYGQAVEGLGQASRRVRAEQTSEVDRHQCGPTMDRHYASSDEQSTDGQAPSRQNSRKNPPEIGPPQFRAVASPRRQRSGGVAEWGLRRAEMHGGFRNHGASAVPDGRSDRQLSLSHLVPMHAQA